MAKRSRKYLEAAKLVDRNIRYSLTDACDLVKKTSITKFDATVELAVRLNLDSRKAEQNLRGAIILPNGSGKDPKVLVLTKGAKQKEAEAAGADFFGDTEYVEKIKGGWADIDVIIATPDVMVEVGKLGKILGPRGLMPNPKSGTVTLDVATAVKEVKAGKIEFRVDKAGVLHATIGKVNFEKEKLADNIRAFLATVGKLKPSTSKGQYVKSIFVSTTMGPSVQIDRTVVQS